MIPRINCYIFLDSVKQFVLVKRKSNIFSEVGAQLFELRVEPLTNTKKTLVKLAAKCNKNEQQDAKINAEL